MVKKKVEVEGLVCDFCNKPIFHEDWRKCLVCGKDVCGDCNPLEDLSYGARRLTLCKAHIDSLSLSEFMIRVKAHFGEEG